MADRGRRTRRSVLAGLRIVAVGLVAGSVTAAVTGNERIIATVGLLIAVLTLAVEAWSLLSDLASDRIVSPQQQADSLATVVRIEWREEAAARRLRDPGLLPLTWAQTARAVTDPPSAVLGQAVPAAARLRLDGRMDGDLDDAGRQLATAYRRIPSRRLVVLGEPGAGKSVLALMLTLGLLDERAAGGPVPVLLSASGWDPTSQSLDEWLVHTLAHAYYNGQAAIPDMLLRHDLILPVLDGLDEIPEDQRRGAVASINRSVRTDRAVIVTCRSVEYEDLIAGGAPVLRRAPVVEVSALSAADVAAYLNRLDWPDGTSWAAVTRVLGGEPGAPVSLALSTPLMVAVARTVYQRLGGDPGELTRADILDSRHAVEDFLTDRMVDAAYAPPDGTSSGPPPGSPRSDPWNASQARHYLTSLAEYLHRYRERDLAWWLLAPRLLSPWVAPALGIVGGVLLMVVVAGWIAIVSEPGDVPLAATVWIGAGCGGTFAVLLALFWYAAAGRSPGQLSLARNGSRARLRRGFGSGFGAALIPVVTVLVGVIATITVSGSWRLENVELVLEGAVAAVSLCAVIGLGLALHDWLNAPPRVAAKAGPLDLMRQDRRSAWVGAAAAGAVVGALAVPGAVAGAVLGTLLAKLVTGWAGWPGPFGVRALVRAETHDVTLGIFRTPALLVGGMVLLPAVVVFSLVFLTRAWPRFVLARVLLAASGRLPWRLPAFLADARERDLLRQAGGVYQFRHVRVQEHLVRRRELLRKPRQEPTEATVATGVPGQETRRSRPAVRRLGIGAVGVLALGAVAVALVPRNGADAVLAAAHGSGTPLVELSPDGRFLAYLERPQHRIALWDLQTRSLRARLSLDDVAPVNLRFSDNGGLVAADIPLGDEPRRTRSSVWNTDSGRRVVAGVDFADFLDGGRTLVTGGYEPVVLDVWDVVAGSKQRLEGTSIAVGGERHFVTAPLGGFPQIWDAATRRPLGTLDVPYDDLAELEFTADESAVHAGAGEREYYWRTSSGQRMFVLPNGSGEAVDSGSRHAAITGGSGEPGAAGTRLSVWDTRDGRQLVDLPGPRNGFPGSPNLRFSPDARWLALDVRKDDEGVEEPWIVNVSTGERAIRASLSSTLAFLVSPTGASDVLASLGYGDGGRPFTRFFDLATGRERNTSEAGLELLPASIGAQAEPAGNSWAGRSPDGRLLLLDVRTGRRLLDLPKINRVESLGLFSPDGSIFLSGRDDRYELWDAATGRSIGRLAELNGRPLSAKDATAVLQDRHVAGKRSTAENAIPSRWLRSVSGSGNVVFSADGRHLLTADGASEVARLWDVRTARLVRTLTGHSGSLAAIGFTPDSRTAITVGRSDDTVRLWDA